MEKEEDGTVVSHSSLSPNKSERLGVGYEQEKVEDPSVSQRFPEEVLEAPALFPFVSDS